MDDRIRELESAVNDHSSRITILEVKDGYKDVSIQKLELAVKEGSEATNQRLDRIHKLIIVALVIWVGTNPEILPWLMKLFGVG